MVARNVAAADGLNADLARLALAIAARAAALIMVYPTHRVIHAVSQEQRRAARCVDLAVVVLFQNLDVRLIAEELSRLLAELKL